MHPTDELLALAPTDLPVYRPSRYDGGGFGVSLADFAEQDRQGLHSVYQLVKTIADLPAEPAERSLLRLREEVLKAGSDAFLSQTQALGTATLAADLATPVLRKALHDIRGGALCALVGNASFLPMCRAPEALLATCALLARDHAKIMRNALVDIDPERRDADEAARVHGIDGFVRKWAGTEIRLGEQAVRVAVHSTFHGCITARCLETSAIDRILYNHVNNAARFCADGRVDLTIFSIGAGLVRWVVSNPLPVDQQEWLLSTTGGDLRRLYAGGLTRGGQGIGLSACAEFVAASFGLPGGREAVDRGYLGARLSAGRYHAWFHWPAYTPTEADSNEPFAWPSDHGSPS